MAPFLQALHPLTSLWARWLQSGVKAADAPCLLYGAEMGSRLSLTQSSPLQARSVQTQSHSWGTTDGRIKPSKGGGVGRVTFSVGKADGVKPRGRGEDKGGGHAEGRLPQQEEEEGLTTASTIPALASAGCHSSSTETTSTMEVVCPIVNTFQILEEKFNIEISFYQISYNLWFLRHIYNLLEKWFKL